MKRQPRDKISPPTTAVMRVDFLLQIAIVSGDIKRGTQRDIPPSQPEIVNNNIWYYRFYFASSLERQEVTLTDHAFMNIQFLHFVLILNLA